VVIILLPSVTGVARNFDCGAPPPPLATTVRHWYP